MHKRSVVVDRHVDSVGRRREHDHVGGGARAAIDG
jgi:hypothetical protein